MSTNAKKAPAQEALEISDAEDAQKAVSPAEEELRLRVRPGTRQTLAT